MTFGGYHEKKTILKMCVLAVLMALSAVLKKFSFDTGEYRISLFDTPLLLAGILAGPLWGMLVAFASDFIYSILSGYAYSFIMMFSALLWGQLVEFSIKEKFSLFPYW